MMGRQVGIQAQPCCLEKRFVLSTPQPPSALSCDLSVHRDPSPITGTCKVWLLPPLN